tara:strand:- start:8984 stop:9331 length:348 start_codon:yes stop_codon:yes gene_type:complete
MNIFEDDNAKQKLRDAFVDNECGSDQYRETQPWVTFHRLSAFEDIGPDNRAVLMRLVQAWVIAYNSEGCSWYAGAEDCIPLYEKIFDLLWEQGEHPYYSEEELPEILQQLEDNYE